MSKNISTNFKESSKNHKRKHIMSLTFYHEKNPKKLKALWLITNHIVLNESEVEVLPKPSAYNQSEYLKNI